MQHTYPVYLKIQPETYRIEKRQLFDIGICQFCGNDNKFLYNKTMPTATPAAHTNWNKGIRWVQKCGNCKQAVSVVMAQKD